MTPPRAHASLLALAVAACWAAPAAANPLDPRVVAGPAAFAQQGKLLTVTTGERAIIDWRAFSIAADETTRFAQAGAQAAVLNRVTGNTASALLGQLQSNGRVYLINPNGILIGNGARIDTAGFVASSLALSDADFLSGRLRFTDGDKAGAVINQGAIQGRGALVALIGAQVDNHGRIDSAGGQVVAAAARGVELLDAYSPDIRVVLDATSDTQLHRVLNRGTLSVALAETADAVGARLEGGRIVLHAAGDTLLEGSAVVSADNAAGKGGAVRVLGDRVGLFDTAKVSAGGTAGGGEILVGGDAHGANPEVRNATAAYLAPDATLDASATRAGDGGKVVVWAEDTARVFGTLTARGAAIGNDSGAGGFVETSGKRFLDVAGIRVDAAGAGDGKAGTWLLDPYNIEVVAGAGTANNGGAPAFTPGGDNSQVGADLIVAQLDAGTSVTLNTAGAGSQAGNIVINAPIVKSANNSAGLTLTADNDITINQSVSLSTNNLATSTTSGANAQFIATAGGAFAINNATVEAFHVSVNAASISRSGAQANDFVFGFVFPTNGTLTLTTQSGAVGSLANPIRFANPDFAGRTWAVSTVNAGAAGNIFIQPTKNDYGTFGGAAIQTDPATVQTVVLNHTGNSEFYLFDDITGNDDWTINSASRFISTNFGGGGNGGTLTAHSITATVTGDIGGSSGAPGNPGTVFDTSAANGNITMTAGSFSGTGCGGDNFGFGVKPGSGTVTATATGIPSCGASIQLAHFGGDLLTSRYVLDFTGGGAGNYMRLKAADGHLVVDSTAGFNASLNNAETLLQTLAGGKNIIFQGGTVNGGRVEIRAAGSIDNLAPGTDGFVQTNAFGGPYWMLVAGGGIGATNPVEGRADWVGSVATSGAGAAGDIRIKFNGGATPRFGEVRTAAGSAQNITIDSAVGLVFSTAQPGYGGVLGGGSSSVTANDAYTINAAGTIHFDNFDNSFTASTITMTSGGGVNQGTSGGGDMMATTGLLTVNANGGSIGSAANPARLRGSGTKTLYARDDLYLHAGSNPLTLTGLTTGAGAGTIGLTTTAAHDLTLGGTTNIDDALVLTIGGNIIFPAAADFTTSGGLTLNSPTQIAASASVNVNGGSFGGAGAVTNAGTVRRTGTGSGDFSGGFSNSGVVRVQDAGAVLGFSGGYTDAGGDLEIRLDATVNAPAAGFVFTTGQLSGVGTINGNVTVGTALSPGSSPGTLVITGNYVQTATGTLNVELGGTTQGVNYDLLQVGGTATLDGTLNATYVGPYVASAGDVYDIITYAARVGDFATFTLPDAAMTASAGAATYQLLQPVAAVAATAPTPLVLKVAASGLFDALDKLAPLPAGLTFAPATDATDDEEKPDGLPVCN